jgi:amino acid transporter
MKEEVTLAKGALGTAESVVMGVAGTAPAFSVAATTSTLVAAVGLLSAGSILYCGLIMLGVTLSFMYLNQKDAHAGASYAWVGQVFTPMLGFLSGWALLVASAVFMVSGTFPAATSTLLLIAPGLADSPVAVSLVAMVWLTVVSIVIIKGIKPTSYTQIVMTGLEVVILIGVIVLSFVEYGEHATHPFSWAWFSLGEFTPSLFAHGALISLFFFWGWDVTANLNEETRDAEKAAGRAALYSMFLVILVFIAFVCATQLVLSDEEINQSATNIVFTLADHLLPRPWSYLAVLAVMLSSIGTLETSILQFSRTLYAQARDGSLNRRYAKLHPNWQTPWVATIVIAAFGLILLLISAGFPSINEIIQDSVNAISFQVAFYYSLTGLACAWHYRREALKGVVPFIMVLAWPLLSALVLIFIGIYSLSSFDTVALVVSIGGILIGFIPYFWNRAKRGAQNSLSTH